MLPLTTTLTAIRAARPCEGGWSKLLGHLGKPRTDAAPLPLTVILDSNGLDDTLWALENVMGLRRICVLFAADCAAQVLPLFERERPDDSRPRRAIEVARDPHASATTSAASDAAWAASDAARAAAYAASGAASAAARAAASAAASARLRQYLIHGEAASALPWETPMIQETML